MSWTDIFRSRYVRLLEAEAKVAHLKHAEELSAVRESHAEEIESLKKVHAEERERCMLETNRAWGEVDRLRQYLLPGMPTADRSIPTADDGKPPAAPDLTQVGTPWQRTQARYAKMQELEALAEEAAKKQKEMEKQNAASN